MRSIVASAVKTICTSQAEREEVGAIVGAAAAARLAMVPSGIPVPPPIDSALRAAVRAELGLRDTDVAALFLGELEERKCPLVAVQAAREAAELGAPIVLLVAGEGPQAPAVRAQASDAVRSLGFRRDPERLLAAADIFVLPSTREGLSFAVLEAMASALAMVVSDGPGNPEAVGDSGIVVPVGDSHALADVLVRLAGDGVARRALGDAARERMSTMYNAERMIAGVGAAYTAALAAYGA
jgi:glycosyltransferase involved in cell wall biosynthesis